jgi:phosphate starvation-inducible PhoH-like protein
MQQPQIIKTKGNSKPLEAKNDAQAAYINSIKVNQLTFGMGPAGTGKSYVAAVMAADMLKEDNRKRLIITRPAVEAGESLGFLPGEMDEKFDPYFAPIRQVLEERLGTGHLEAFLQNGRIQALPLAYMRGHTFKDCIVILDEAQNTTPVQMKLFLTRIGEYSKIIVNGDLQQTDIRGKNGLKDALSRVRNLKSVGIAEFTRKDIVRSGLVQEIVEAYEVSGESDDDHYEPPAFLKNGIND